MIDHSVYKLLHLIGIIMTFVSLGGVMLYVNNGGTKEENILRKPVAITHGIGVLLILLGGFGMLARLGLSVLSGWVIIKLVIWIVLGGITVLIYRAGESGKNLWYIVILLGAFAAYLAINKPF